MLTVMAMYLQSSHTSHSVFRVIERTVLFTKVLSVVLTKQSLSWKVRSTFRALNKKKQSKVGLEEVLRSTSLPTSMEGRSYRSSVTNSKFVDSIQYKLKELAHSLVMLFQCFTSLTVEKWFTYLLTASTNSSYFLLALLGCGEVILIFLLGTCESCKRDHALLFLNLLKLNSFFISNVFQTCWLSFLLDILTLSIQSFKDDAQNFTHDIS